MTKGFTLDIEFSINIMMDLHSEQEQESCSCLNSFFQLFCIICIRYWIFLKILCAYSTGIAEVIKESMLPHIPIFWLFDGEGGYRSSKAKHKSR
jgi:hypothetical protein